MPRARSSGALSIDPKSRYLACPCMPSTFVIAAVSVVLPWSTCPIVPTFTCGLFRSNLCFAIASHHLVLLDPGGQCTGPVLRETGDASIIGWPANRRSLHHAAPPSPHTTSSPVVLTGRET